jgi:hypothetical protein
MKRIYVLQIEVIRDTWIQVEEFDTLEKALKLWDRLKLSGTAGSHRIIQRTVEEEQLLP